ncbi:hypothetical protein ACNF42_07175 [Cuniculiplasma sp. SKW3]
MEKEIEVSCDNVFFVGSDPRRFLASSEYTLEIGFKGNHIYSVKFRWKKFGIIRIFEIEFSLKITECRIVYEGIEEYKDRFRFAIDYEKISSGKTRIEVEAKMDAGKLPELIGKGDFKKFVEKIVEDGMRNIETLFLTKI